MNTIWYGEQRRFDNNFYPVLFHQDQAPTGVHVDGTRFGIRNVRLLPPQLVGRSMSDIQSIMNEASHAEPVAAE